MNEEQQEHLKMELRDLAARNQEMTRRLAETEGEIIRQGEIASEMRNRGFMEGKLAAWEKIQEDQEQGRKGGTGAHPKLPLLKPKQYADGGNFRQFLRSFLIFANAAEIPLEMQVNTLITFLGQSAQMQVETLRLTDADKRDASACFAKITRAIEGPGAKRVARSKLFKIQQGPTESIANFVARMTDLSNRVYGVEKSDIKNQICLDIFMSNMYSDAIAIDLIKEGITDFQDVYERALDLEGMHSLRSTAVVEESANLFTMHEEQGQGPSLAYY